jgi:hypothetical protein
MHYEYQYTDIVEEQHVPKEGEAQLKTAVHVYFKDPVGTEHFTAISKDEFHRISAVVAGGLKT